MSNFKDLVVSLPVITADPSITWTTVASDFSGLTLIKNQSISTINLTTTGGDGGITYTLQSGTLPSGITFMGGAFGGTPDATTAFTTPLTFRATDSMSNFKDLVVSLPAITGGGAETVTFTTAKTLPSASASDNINQQIVATGSQGSTPVTYTFISINNSGNSNTSTATPFTLTGNTISGIAPRLLNAATYSLEIQASIQAGTITNNRTFTLLISQDATCVSPTDNICT